MRSLFTLAYLLSVYTSKFLENKRYFIRSLDFLYPGFLFPSFLHPLLVHIILCYLCIHKVWDWTHKNQGKRDSDNCFGDIVQHPSSICGSNLDLLFRSYSAGKMSSMESEQRINIKFCVKLNNNYSNKWINRVRCNTYLRKLWWLPWSIDRFE